MKVLIQRVKKASVTIDNKLYSEIESGILALVGIQHWTGRKTCKKNSESTNFSGWKR